MTPVFTKWRESPSLLVFQRSRFHARRHKCSLEVSTNKTGNTVARVERRRLTADGGFDTIATQSWPSVLPNAVLFAQRWCEQQADIATGNAPQ